MKPGTFAAAAFLVVPFIAAAQTGPARASEKPTYFQCTRTHASWNRGADESEIEGPKPEAGRWSGVVACRVGGHELLVRSQQWTSSSYRCSASQIAAVSVWVDRRKVVSKEEAGSYESCENDYLHNLVLESVRLNADGSVRICRGDEGQAELPLPSDKLICRRLSAKRLQLKRKDPSYAPAGQRTERGMVVRYGDAQFCGAFTPSLDLTPRPFGETDGSLARFTLPQAQGWVDAGGETGGGDPQHAVFDIDNDGTPDEVSLDLEVRQHGEFLNEFTWRAVGAQDKAHRLGDLPDFAPKSPTVKQAPEGDATAPAFMFRPVSVGGRVYVYVSRWVVSDWSIHDWDAEAGASPEGAQALTRGLLELHPDGSTTLRCGWGPRLRPEEFL